MKIGLELRKAWLVNGIIFNSEVWHSVADSDIAPFVGIDKYLLKGLLTAHAKTPLEHIYLETAALPIPYIITTRRLIYLKHILDRSDTEVTNKIYRCQKANPSPGDWCNLVEPAPEEATGGARWRREEVAGMWSSPGTQGPGPGAQVEALGEEEEELKLEELKEEVE